MVRPHRVTSEDGTALHVVDAGPEDAPAILLIHGWSQHHLSWSKQLKSDLPERFRLIAPDLRGHGASDKPDAPEAYDNPLPWAGDVAAIIAQLELVDPILVGWSMGGWVLNDYLSVHGEAGIAGAVWVGSTPRMGSGADPEAPARKPDIKALGAYSEDQGKQLKAIIAFVKACSAGPLSKYELAQMVGFNMLVPPHIRQACRMRDFDYREVLQGVTKPAMIVQGAAERVCLKSSFEEMTQAMPEAETHVLSGCGHLPFWEDAPSFNAALAGFAERVFGERLDFSDEIEVSDETEATDQVDVLDAPGEEETETPAA